MEKKKENMLMFYFLSFTWGILWTLIGLLVLLFIRIFLNKKVKEYRIVAGRIAIIMKGSLPGAFELGIAYIVSEYSYTSYELHAHEIGHSIQNARYGPFFIFLVIAGAIRFNLWDWFEKRHYKKYGTQLGYDDVWFEGEATQLGLEYCEDRIIRDLKKGR